MLAQQLRGVLYYALCISSQLSLLLAIVGYAMDGSVAVVTYKRTEVDCICVVVVLFGFPVCSQLLCRDDSRQAVVGGITRTQKVVAF